MNRSLSRKIFYFVCIGVLGLLLWGVGRPAKVVVQAGGETRNDSGGLLAQKRAAEGLTESQIGQIDPASSTVKLATFGMRGVAIALLWHRVQEQQKRHNWNTVVALANQLVFLEKHFTTIWEFLGWNLAYNASAEFDDYRERYRWVIRGVDFLATGIENNTKAPKLIKACGWTMSQKIGGAGSDENEQYRRLLKDDEDFGSRHGCPLPSDRDNWLLGNRWYHQGEELVLRGGISLFNESEFVYFANSRLNLFNYAKWKRKDGIFGEEAIHAWENAGNTWREFAQLDLATAIPEGSEMRVTKANVSKVRRTKLELTDQVREENKALQAELNAIVPSLREKLLLERWKEVGETKGQQGSLFSVLKNVVNWDDDPKDFRPVADYRFLRAWLDKNQPDWQAELQRDYDSLFTPEQLALQKVPTMFLEDDRASELRKAYDNVGQISGRVGELLRITPKLLAENLQDQEEVSREQKSRARAIVDELDTLDAKTRYSNLFRGIVNYDAHLEDVAVEVTQQADEAQKLRYEARKAYYDGRIADSISGWLNAMKKWEELLTLPRFKKLVSQNDFIRDHIDIVEKFVIILDNDNKIFSDVTDDPVPLRQLMWNKAFGEYGAPELRAALDYAKKEYNTAVTEKDAAKRQRALETVEKYFAILSGRYANHNEAENWLRLGPFFDLRDQMIESLAYYINTLTEQKKPLPGNLPLQNFVELMLQHDKELAKTKEPTAEAVAFLQDKKFDEAQKSLDQAVAIWKDLLAKYPIILHNEKLPVRNDAIRTATLYTDAVKGQNKPLPDDFPLKELLKK